MRFVIPCLTVVALTVSTASAQQPVEVVVPSSPPPVVVAAPPVVVQRPVVVVPPPVYPGFGLTIARPGLTIGIGSGYPAYGYYARPYYGGYGHYHHHYHH